MNFKSRESETKLRGGYYTPESLADFIVRWVKNIKPKKILEPSCGDGVFLKAIDRHINNADISAIEFLKKEANKARDFEKKGKKNNFKVKCADFLSWSISKLEKKESIFDAVVGNPPFIRYQYLPKEFQNKSEQIFKLKKCNFTKHTNAWVPFLISSISLLRNGGRFGMVIPAEIMHVMHAQSLRKFLENECYRIFVIDPQDLWFEGVLQGAVILLAEKKIKKSQMSKGLIVERVKGKSFLGKDPEIFFSKNSNKYMRNLDQKWMRAIISKECNELLTRLKKNKKIKKFSQIAKVDVGIVTGANKFFLVDDKTIKNYNLNKYAYPMFGRSEHCPGIIYDQFQHKKNKKKGLPTNFLHLTKSSINKNIKLKKYLQIGIKEKIHHRYKCRIRKPWYEVPSVYKTGVGMLKRCHDSPKLILNSFGAYTTDTAYRVKTNGFNKRNLVYSFINSLTSLSAEIEGRHYGGGVLELVPSEIEELLIPIIPDSLASPKNLYNLNKSVKSKKMTNIVEQQSSKILSSIGVSKKNQHILYDNWLLLKNRRQRI